MLSKISYNVVKILILFFFIKKFINFKFQLIHPLLKHIKLLIVLLLPLGMDGQSIKGFIYDNEAPISGGKIINRTQNILTYSDDKGAFQIEAQVNDVLVINSYFHNQEFISLNSSHFKEDLVIELKKITNELDVVEIREVKEKIFDSITFSVNTAKQGQIAYKERTFGSGANLRPTLDLIAVTKLIGKLFKKKNRQADVIYVAPEDLVTLFETNTYFNQKYLITQLEIPKPYQQLFFDYCSAQQLNTTILKKENEFMLVDLLLTHSEAFKKILEAHTKS
jgi:Holliday junction resolvase